MYIRVFYVSHVRGMHCHAQILIESTKANLFAQQYMHLKTLSQPPAEYWVG